MPRFMLVATMKNEGPHLAEWVAHYRSLGFDDIVVYQNGSTDFTDRSLSALGDAGIIQYYNNEIRRGVEPKPYQNRALRRSSELPSYQEADWCMHLDGDEFLNISTPEGTVQSLVEAVEAEAGRVDEIRVNWRMFGCGYLERFDDRMMTERFVWCEPRENVANVLIPFKTLFRARSFLRPGIHRPKDMLVDASRVATASGLPAEAFEEFGFRSTDPGQYRFAQLNHYAVRDKESFLLKAARGSASNVTRSIDIGYWNRHNRNEVQEFSMAQRAPRTRALMQELDELTEGRLLGVRRRSVRRWQLGIEELRALPEFSELANSLPTVSPS